MTNPNNSTMITKTTPEDRWLEKTEQRSMNRYAIDHSRGRVILPAKDPDHARAKMSRLYGDGRYEPIRLPNINPATPVATTPKTMSKKTTKKTAPKAQKNNKAKAVKPTLGEKVAKLAKPAKEGMSGLDAAALVLKGHGKEKSLKAKEIVEEIQSRKLAPKLCGLTPHATIYAAMITEIAKKGEQSRFARGAQKGTFTYQEPKPAKA